MANDYETYPFSRNDVALVVGSAWVKRKQKEPPMPLF